MGEQLRPDRLTPVNATDVYLALRRAWESQVTDVALDTEHLRSALLVLLAQWSLETAAGKAMHWYNLGNFKRVPGHDFTHFRHNEIVNGKEVWSDGSDPFAAFDSLDDGTAYYLRAIRTWYKGSLWPAVLAGDVPDFAHRLKKAGYYTAGEPVYTAGLIRCLAVLDRQIGRDTVPEPLAADRSAFLNEEAEEVGDEPPPSAA
jgi:hypothetical protein